MITTSDNYKATRVRGHNGRIYQLEGRGPNAGHILMVELAPGVRITDTTTDKTANGRDWHPHAEATKRPAVTAWHAAGWYLHLTRSHWAGTTKRGAIAALRQSVAALVVTGYHW